MGHISSSSRAFFVTGTDTEVGKTFVTVGLLHALKQKEYKTAGYKPIAAGCRLTNEGLRNEDALALQLHSSLDLSYDEVNPLTFEAPIAPHLAAKHFNLNEEESFISIDLVREGFVHLMGKKPDVLITEGAGGWRLPLGENFSGKPKFLSEFVKERNLAVILVVGLRLGCLNHAVLTAESIKNDGLKIAGWVANHIESDMPFLEENIESLKTLIDAPLLGSIPRLGAPQECANYLDISLLSL
ncbi:MAG: dethiobiotin synthase [Paraglaciecola sp.]|uniref:dethiobiotin synthase n=1 Tax=Paraglaciecola sp. TaxID=1920173 RepID=UPI003265E761